MHIQSDVPHISLPCVRYRSQLGNEWRPCNLQLVTFVPDNRRSLNIVIN